ncbi:MAG: SHOCT domain-containing protein [Clostridia bacterium]|nr:SHOCT domain-containing protein [Clostridia bacterium]
MNEIKKNPGVRARIPIAILALTYVLLNSILSIIRYKGHLFGENAHMFLAMLPILLLGIYFLALHKIQPATPYVVFAMLAVNLSTLTISLGSLWSSGSYNFLYVLRELFDGGISESNMFILWYVVASIVPLLMSVAIFFLIKGGRTGKIMLIVTAGICCLEPLFYAAKIAEEENASKYVSHDAVSYISALLPILLYAALILYAAFNTPPTYVPSASKSANTDMPLSRELEIYQELLVKGRITPEEYEEKRIEINNRR